MIALREIGIVMVGVILGMFMCVIAYSVRAGIMDKKTHTENILTSHFKMIQKLQEKVNVLENFYNYKKEKEDDDRIR